MSNCCNPIEQIYKKKKVLIIVLIINTIMFFIQFMAGLSAHSTALLADSLDMLGDALAYLISLYAVGKKPIWLVRAALIKAGIIAFFGIGILFEATIKIFYLSEEIFPQSFIMGIFSLLGLFANGVCFYLLTHHRQQDINMRSAWICARNDILVNSSVFITAVFIMLFKNRWPDIIVGMLLANILIFSAIKIIYESILQLRKLRNRSHFTI